MGENHEIHHKVGWIWHSEEERENYEGLGMEYERERGKTVTSGLGFVSKEGSNRNCLVMSM